MWISPAAIPLVFKNSIAISACVLLLCTASVTQQQDNSSSPASSATEEQALKVLNESDWARSVTPTVQDVPCTYRNAAFPGLYPEPEAAELDELYSGVPREPIKPDSSAYLIRFQSAKPVQTAVEQLIALGDKWADYRTLNYQSKEFSAPTDLTRPRYNLADMITIAVILKHPGPDGTVLFDYGYKDNGRLFPSSTFRVWPCAGLRTANGHVFARVVPVP